jgi:ankyrin repeat protein
VGVLFNLVLVIFGLIGAPSVAQSVDDDPYRGATAALLASDMPAFEKAIAAPGLDLDGQVGGQVTLLHVAASAGNAAAVKALIDAGADIDVVDQANGWSPLMVAVYQGKVEVAQLLKESGADLDIVGNDKSTARVLARYSGLSSMFDPSAKDAADAQETREEDGLDEDVEDVVDAFLQQEALNPILLKAAEAGDSELVSELIEKGADPNASSEAGWTPLLYPSLRNDRSLFNRLVYRHGASTAHGPEQRLSFVQAALIGAAGNKTNSGPVVAFLSELKRNGFYDGSEDDANRDLAINLGLSEAIVSLFVAPPPPPLSQGSSRSF